MSSDGLTHDELVIACRNIGYDLTCGQCAAVFYCGHGTYPHDSTCTTPRDREAKVEITSTKAVEHHEYCPWEDGFPCNCGAVK